MKHSSCILCNPIKSTVLYETRYFYVMQDYFQLIDNHISIISRGHFSCSAEIYKDEVMNELEFLKAFVKEMYMDCYRSFCIFEYGHFNCLTEDNEANRKNHFSLNILPFNPDIEEELEKFGMKYYIDDISSIRQYADYGKEYIYIETALSEACLFLCDMGEIPSDLVRHLIVNKCPNFSFLH